jgi:hypothetical protein
MPWGTLVAHCLTALVALALLAIDALMSFRFGLTLGRTELDAEIYGSALALADILLALIPFIVAHARKNERRVRVVAGLALWVVCSVFAFTSAVGFGISNRSFVNDATILQAGVNRSALATLQSDDQELARVRSLLSATNLHGHDRQELQLQEASLHKETSDLRSRLDVAPSVLTPTTQSDAIAQMLGVDPSRVTNGLVILLATLLELGSGVGLFVALGAFERCGENAGTQPPSMTGTKPARRDRDRSLPRRTGNIVLLPVNRDPSAIINGWLNLQRVREGSFCGASDLDRALAAYCTSRNLPVPSMRRLAEALAKRGFAKDRRGPGGRVRYLGIEIVTPQMATA